MVSPYAAPCRLACIGAGVMHYHHVCWSCEGDVVTRSPWSYGCTACEVTERALPDVWVDDVDWTVAL